MTLKELQERLERAEGPDRELDAELFRIIVTADSFPGFFGACTVKTIAETNGNVTLHSMGEATGKWSYVSYLPAEHYTASLDAAVALVEKMLPGVRRRQTKFETGDISIVLQHFGDTLREGTAHIDPTIKPNATEALALCTALVKAMGESE